jgi:hypothetical protein
VNCYRLRLISIAGQAYREIASGPDRHGAGGAAGPPRDDRASAPGGFDWISSSVGVGLGLNASKLGMVEDDPQAASPKAQITAVKAQSNFMSAFPRRCTSLRRAASSMPQLRRRKAHQSRRRSRPTRCAPPGWSAIRRPTSQQKCHHDTLPTRECLFRNRRFRPFWGHGSMVLRFRQRVARRQRMAWS